MMGSEAFGLYCVADKEFIRAIVKSVFDRRKEIYLIEDRYDYDENDEHDMLNCIDMSGEFDKNIDAYKAYIQNVDAGVYIIVAKDIQIER